ncbi:forkhead box protein L2 [Xylariaceae sp. FL0662B]|nr:forkhead box protein L2 [Xylariaceae sp. FL0662B]
MAKSTRFAADSEPLHIFQDDFFDQQAPSISRAPMPSVGKQSSPRRALQNSNGNVVFNPPNAQAKQHSPFKATGRRATASPLAPLKSSNSSKINSVSILPPTSHGQTTDSMQKKQPLMSRFKTVVQKPSVDAIGNSGKENVHPTLYPAPPTFSLNIENYYPKPPGKRALLEAAPIQESRPAKKTKLDEAPLPPPDSFPPIHDDGTKPGHSYAQLIGMAILRAPQRRLTLSQIYKWISDTYSFYNANDAGWQNSIRHNLSLNKAFIKQERPKDDPGKGNYWAIEIGMEHQFMKEKPSRKSAAAMEHMSIMSNRSEPAHVESTIFHDGLPSLPPVFPAQAPLYSQDSMPSQNPSQSVPEVSSDATIPLSDNVGPEEQADKVQEHGLPLERGMCSPLPPAMHSSPPMPRHLEPRSKTPPPAKREPPSSASRMRTHRRKYASIDTALDDSGYISSLESSVTRPNQSGRVHSSGADRSRINRGRAEEEIARLRASSYDSPTKSRSYGFVPPSSSPLRHANDSGQMLPPLTPALKVKPPPKPPASVSPNTNLRIHRDNVRHMLNSPLRRVSGIPEDVIPWSPAFHMDDSIFNLNDYVTDPTGFDIFQDDNLDSFFSAADNGSPLKRSARRMRPERCHSANALSEITNSVSKRSITSAPLLKPPTPSVPAPYETPSKVLEGMSSPSKLFLESPIATKNASPMKNGWSNIEEFCSTHFFEDDLEDCPGMDILQGFERIGGSQNTNGSKPSKPSKPALGRSYTTTF